jgi:DNA-binding LacI/PurR family transcriptional regulator
MTRGPERSKHNIRTIAQRAGVSSATVSRVINGLPAVKKETAQRVRKIIRDLDFIPSPIASTLKYGRSKTYGVIVPDLKNLLSAGAVVNASINSGNNSQHGSLREYARNTALVPVKTII